MNPAPALALRLAFLLAVAGSIAHAQPPIVSVAAVDPKASEMPPLLPAIDSARFRFERSGDTVNPLSVWFSTGGTATPGRDYQNVISPVSFRAGAATVDIEIVPIDDPLAEGEESVVLEIQPDPAMGPIEHYRIDEKRAAAKALILDNDPAPRPARIEVLSPRDGTVFPLGAPIPIAAVAVDPQGAITYVEFYAGDKKIGESRIDFFRPPDPGTPIRHETVWRDAPAGYHALSARATDTAGHQASSPPTRILVRDPAPLGFVKRELPAAYVPGQPFEVTLLAQPPRHGSAWAVADRPPNAWAVDEIGDDGAFDAATGQVKFGPFTDGLARRLTYRVTPPASASGRHEFVGQAALDGRTFAVAGDHAISPLLQSHPADLNPDNSAIDMAELTAYAAAWKEGNAWPAGPVPIPLSYVTRAGFLWKHGEKYTCQPEAGLPPQCWVPSSANGDPGLPGATAPLAIRSLAGPVLPGSAVDVRIQVTPAASAAAVAVQESIPEGWTFDGASSQGTFDAAQRAVRWGPFYTTDPLTLSYRVVPPARIASLAALRGVVSCDGYERPILGTVIALAEDATTAIRFRSVVPGEDGLHIQISGAPGQICQVESSTDLRLWTPHQLVFVLDDGTVNVEDMTATAHARFFRVRPPTTP